MAEFPEFPEFAELGIAMLVKALHEDLTAHSVQATSQASSVTDITSCIS